MSVNLEQEKSHGRQIQRQVSVFKSLDSMQLTWCGIQSLIRVERSGKRGNKDYHQVAYYISSLLEKAEVFATRIRGHWQIENQLHWVKDVIFQEDSSQIRHFQARTNLSILARYGNKSFSTLRLFLNYRRSKVVK